MLQRVSCDGSAGPIVLCNAIRIKLFLAMAEPHRACSRFDSFSNWSIKRTEVMRHQLSLV
jgi:hypothetical protein